MQRQRDGLVPIGEVIGGLGGPVQALIPSRSTQHHFTLADQVDQLVTASEADPDRGFMARTMALCSPAPHQPRQSVSVCPSQRPLQGSLLHWLKIAR